ncbi:MAG: beta-N-acetylhexosaminidase [Gammaproteobacteria bacterium]|nr:MAG: beta-N-acetylhexosaminidase [Gammaproteobacteria bacterium]
MGLGPVMLDLAGTDITAEEQDMLRHPACGGVILFTRNYESPGQLLELVRAIHAVRDPHLLVAVDHEGGRVQRFRKGFTHLPAASRIGQVWSSDRERGRALARTMGWLLAAELRAMEIDFSFAPVLDLAHGVSGVIGDRAWHRSPRGVTELAHPFMEGLQEAGMEAVGKHFPGHGGVREDSHLTLPVDERPLEELRQHDLVPFARMVEHGIAGIMPAHVVYRRVDDKPAGFSAFWLNGVLRHELGFQGAIFSDDLSMAAADVGGSFADRARLAIDAGCDMVLVCNHPEGAAEVLDALAGHDDPASRTRLARMHGRGGQPMGELQQTRRWQEAVAALEALEDEPNLELDV